MLEGTVDPVFLYKITWSHCQLKRHYDLIFCVLLTLARSRGQLSKYHLALVVRAGFDGHPPTIHKASCMKLEAFFLHIPWHLILSRCKRLIESLANVVVWQHISPSQVSLMRLDAQRLALPQALVRRLSRICKSHVKRFHAIGRYVND